ncbi:MAG TPA: TonB-dependent receptor, partial [Candidatus Kapabacteria bacterium]
TNDSAWNNLLQFSARSRYQVAEPFQLFGGIEEEHTSFVGNTNLQNGDSLISRYRTSSYAAGKYEPFDNVDVNGSLRVENISDLSLTELLPQAAIDFTPIQYVTLGGAYSKSFHAPTLNDLYWYQGGNAKLQPEHGENWQGSMSFERRWDDLQVTLSGTGFLAHIDNEIVWEPFSGSEYSPINIGEAESEGIEFRGEADWAVDEGTRVHFEGSYTLLNAENITPNDPNYGKEIQYSSPTRSLLIAEIERENIGSLSLLARYRGHEFALPSNDPATELPSVTTFNVTLSSKEFQFGLLGLRAMLSIQNATNVQFVDIPNDPLTGETRRVTYEDILNYPLPDRTYHFSIELTYH